MSLPTSAWTLALLTVLLLAVAPREVAGQTTPLFEEDFESYLSGTTDPGDGSWSIDVSDTDIADSEDYFEVRENNSNLVFEAQDLDGDAIWKSQPIDLSTVSGNSFSITFEEEGGMEDSDFINVEFSTDGGDAFTLIENWDGSSSGYTLNGVFGSATVTKSNLSGTLVVRVTMNNSAGGEIFRMDDVEVTSSTTDPIVHFISKSESVSEGNSVILTAELLNAPSSDVSADVAFSSASSTAESGDMSSATKSITFSAGAGDGATKDASFSVSQDTDPEGPETAVYALQNVSNGSAKTAGTSEFDIEIPSEDLSVPLTEDFDGDPLFGFTIGADARDGTDNYFTLDNGDNINKSYTGVSGTFFAGQDIDDDQVLGSTPGQLTWSDIDITGTSNLSFSGKFAEVLDGNGDIEESDFLTVKYRIDGGSWQELIDFHGSGSSGEFKEDTDSDGVGDGTSISSGSPASMESFSKSISGTGSTLDLRFTASVDAGDEDFAVEDFEIIGTVSPVVRFTSSSGTAQESDGNTTLALEIVNPPSGTQVSADVAFNSSASAAGSGDVTNFGTKNVTFPASPSAGQTQTVTVNLNSGDGEEGSEDAVFDLKNVSGASASAGSPSQFTLTIQDAVSDHDGDILITELMPDPDAPSDSEGEYVELYNPTNSSTSIDGWQVDGSTISNVTVPARGFVVLCRDSDASVNGGIDCDDEVSIGLSNNGEQVELLDGSDTQVDVVDYSGSSFPSIPTGSSLIFTETTANNDGSSWAVASRRERGFALDQSGDDGSPGRNGTDQTLQPAAEITGSAGWRMLSAPMDGVDPDALAQVNLVQGISGHFPDATPNLYQWPGGTETGVDWRAPAATDDLTGGGTPAGDAGGFVWYIFDAAETEFTDTPPFTLSLPGFPRTSTMTTGSLGQGFHLLGNPYAQSIDPSGVDFGGQGFNTTVQVYSPGTGYEQITTSYTADDFIGPYQGFFVERGSGTGALTFDPSDRVADPISLKDVEAVPPRIEFQLVGRDGEGSEVTRDEAPILHAPEGSTVGWDIHDASKLTPLAGRYATAAVRGTADGEPRLQSVASIPQTLPEEGIELSMSLQLQGTDAVETFELAWPTWRNVPDHWSLTLHDAVADTTINLRTHSSYTFTLPVAKAQSVPPPRSPMELPDQIRAKIQSDSPRFKVTVQPNPIPVELATFDATTGEGQVNLKWQTASETNNAGFAVQRRVEAEQNGSWAQVGFVEGAGTTDRPQTYRFTDDDLPFEAERVSYRLRQEDLDGATTLTDETTVGLGAPTKAQLHAPFPNPAAQRAAVRYEVPQATTVEISVYDVLGRRVETVVNGQVPAGREQQSMQTAQWAPGVYFVRMKSGDTVQTERLTIVR